MKLNNIMVCEIITTVYKLGEGKYLLEDLHSQPLLKKYQSQELLEALDMMIFLQLLIGERMNRYNFENVSITCLHLYGFEIARVLDSSLPRLELEGYIKRNPNLTIVEVHEKAKEILNR